MIATPRVLPILLLQRLEEGDLRKFSDIGAWYAIEDCAQYDKKCGNPTSIISDETIANPNAQIVRDDMVRVQVPRCMAWLDYDEHVDSLSTMYNEVGVTSPESTTQILPSFEEYTLPMTYPEEVEKTLVTLIEVEPLNETKLEEVGLNCNHKTPFSSREVPSFDGPEPRPLLNSPSLDVSQGDVIGPEPPIKPHSPDSSRMKVVDYLTTHTPPSPHVANSHPKDDDEPRNKGPNEGEGATIEEPAVEYFDTFPTRDELTYHRYLMSGQIPSIFLRNPIITEGCPYNLKIPCNIRHVHIKKAYIDLNSPLNIMTRMMYNWIMRRKLDPRENANGGISNFTGRMKGMHVFIGNFTYVVDFMIVEDISSIIDPRLSQVVLGRPFVEISNMTHDPPEGAVRFIRGADEVAYKMPHKIEQYNSLSDLEKEHTKSVYLRNEEDKRRGVEYVMSKILVRFHDSRSWEVEEAQNKNKP
ncbi:hypothetical protein Tco_0599636 [Tanacetum coccineum]